MYAKIFDSIYDGSLRRDWKALVVFQQLLVLCDEEGYVDKTAEAISARTTIPIDLIEHGLKELSKPDADSRSSEEGGRRLVLINPARRWGWRIVNYTSYREIKNQDQLRLYWRGQKQTTRALEKSGERHSELKLKLSKLFNRKSGEVWSYMEDSLLGEIARREGCLSEFDELVRMKSRNPKYFPRSLSKLLGDWGRYLDHSRVPEQESDQSNHGRLGTNF